MESKLPIFITRPGGLAFLPDIKYYIYNEYIGYINIYA